MELHVSMLWSRESVFKCQLHEAYGGCYCCVGMKYREERDTRAPRVGVPVIWLHALSLHPFPLCSALHGRLNYACQIDFLAWLLAQCYQLKGRVRLCQPRKVGANLPPGFIQQQRGNRDGGECPGSRARTSSGLSTSPGADSRLPAAECQPSFLCSSTSLFSICPRSVLRFI